MNTVQVLHTRSPGGKSGQATVEQITAEGQRAYIERRPPAFHVVNCPDPTAAAGLHLICTDGLGNFSLTSALQLTTFNRTLLDRGQLPALYPVRASTSHSQALHDLTEYRRAAKHARRAQNDQVTRGQGDQVSTPNSPNSDLRTPFPENTQ